MTGYSKTPLAKKLGYKPGYRVLLKNPPADYSDWVAPLPEGIQQLKRRTAGLDLVHWFVTGRAELQGGLSDWIEPIRPAGMIWISWPKKSSGMPTDVTEDVIREVALPLGLVDVKVCAVSEIWSGLKLVIRKELR